MTQTSSFPDWHGTTILAVRKNGRTVIAGDGQVSMGPTIVKGAARKVRTLAGGKVLAGFAGATADALTLIERLEAKLSSIRINWRAPASNWPRTGAPTAICAGLRPCFWSPTRTPS